VLRERGRSEEAEQLRASSLEQLLSDRRSEGEPDATIDDHLAAILVTEQERVANAAVLAELLLPILSEHLRSSAPLAKIAAVAAPPARPPAAPRVPSTGIADFIDEMIAQERADGSDPASHRRAS